MNCLVEEISIPIDNWNAFSHPVRRCTHTLWANRPEGQWKDYEVILKTLCVSRTCTYIFLAMLSNLFTQDKRFYEVEVAGYYWVMTCCLGVAVSEGLINLQHAPSLGWRNSVSRWCQQRPTGSSAWRIHLIACGMTFWLLSRTFPNTNTPWNDNRQIDRVPMIHFGLAALTNCRSVVLAFLPRI